jgi:two-component system sensor histidine kinase VicK
MFLKSVQWRLVGIFILLTIFLVIPIGLFLNKRIEDRYYDEFISGIEEGFRRWTIDSSDTSFDMLIYLNDQRNIITQFYYISTYKSYTIVKEDDIDNIVYSSDTIYNTSPEKLKIEILRSDNFLKVLAGNEIGEGSSLLHVDGRSYFDYARLVHLKDGDFVLYFRYDSEDWRAIADDFNSILLSSLVISMLISLVLGYMLSKTITGPITRLMHKARDIAAGNFDKPLQVKSDDEIGKLTSAFNYMARNLRDTLIQVSSEKSKVETILNYMTDGVIAFNLEGTVIHANPAAKAMLNPEDTERSFNEFTSKYNMDITLEEVMYLETFTSKETTISAGGRYFKVYFAVFTDEQRKREGIIAVIQDITEQQKLEMMRREFVANVSHELRTPITSIKSYAETLLDGAMENPEISAKFLKVIDSEADRMTRLVKDLLQLSRIDNMQMQWNMKSVSLVDIVKDCVSKMKMEAAVKNQKLEVHVIGDIPIIIGDKDRLEQVLINLLSNAIKYTPDKGEISVFVGKTINDAYIKLSDNGVGIPEQDIPRIFERFYRVDKARSREMGGTGLGLSIAKEIVEAHDGNILITSTEGKGTDVIVKLPIPKAAQKALAEA